jgi:hypothetical protein
VEVPPAKDPRREAALVTRAAPRSVQLVAVPVPSEYFSSRIVHYSIRATGAAAILGKRSGDVDIVAERDPTVLLTIGVQSSALAGRSTVAEVIFTAHGDSVIVPVDLEVTPRRGVTVMSTSDLHLARAGGRVRVGFRLINYGNAEDTVRVRVEAPFGWHARLDQAEAFVLPVGGVATGTVLVEPPTHASGLAPLHIVAMGPRQERGRATTLIEVPTGDGKAGNIRVFPSIAAVVEDARWDDLALGMSFEGPVWRSINMAGRWSRAPRMGTPGLARVGHFAGLPHAAFYAENWRLDLGDAGASFSELAGVNAYGRGASFALSSGKWSGNTLVTRPVSGFRQSADERPLIAGAGIRHRLQSIELFSNLTHLDDGLPNGGQLDAVTTGVEALQTRFGRLRGEVGYRSFSGGSGLGVAGEAERRESGSEYRLRAFHAPGGIEAFARSRNQLSGYLSRDMMPWMRASTGVWYSDDESRRTGRTQNSARAHATTNFTLPRQVSLGVTAEYSSFSMRDPGSFELGNETRGLGLFAGGRFRSVSLSGSSQLLLEERRSALDSLAGPQTDQRVLWRAQAVLPTRQATLQLIAWAQQPIGGASFLSSQNEIQLGVDDIRVPGIDQYVQFGAEISRLGGLGMMAPVVRQRYDAHAYFPGGIRLALDVERNPLFITSRSWTTAVRVEREFSIKAPFSAGRGGLVFQDLNGNGVHDRGEPGLQGVVIRADGEMAVTGSDGRYRMNAVERIAPRLDERSLPYGWLLSPRQIGRLQDFAVVPMSSVEVSLQLSESVGLQTQPVNFVGAGIMARDEADRTWVARVDSVGLAVFEALPPGKYQLVADLSRVSEPLLTRGELPVFETVNARQTIRLTLPVHRRPVRVWRAGSTNTGDSIRVAQAPATQTPLPSRVSQPQVSPVTAIDAAPMEKRPWGGSHAPMEVHRVKGALPVVEARVWWMGGSADSLLKSPSIRHARFVVHRLRRGEYLRKVAEQYLRDERRWKDYIWPFNPDSISDPDVVREGQSVLIYAPESMTTNGNGAPRR